MGLNAKGGGGGGGGPREMPKAGNAKAVVVAVIDLGTHMEAFQQEEAKRVHKVMLVYEILRQQDSRGMPFCLSQVFTLSVGKNAKLRPVVEACGFPDPPAGFDVGRLLGRPLRFVVKHTAKGEGEEKRVFVDPVMHSLADEEDSVPPGEFAKTRSVPFKYAIEGGEYVECDWIPWAYFPPLGRRCSPGEMIAASLERQRGGAAPQRPQPAGAGAGGSPAGEAF